MGPPLMIGSGGSTVRTRLKGVNRVVAKGRVYYYHRPTKTRIKARYGTAAFDAEVTALNMRVAVGAADLRPGTLGGLIKRYRESVEFSELKRSTQILQDWHMEWLKPLAGMPLHAVSAPFVIELRDRMFKAHKRIKANHLIDLFKVLWNWGLPRGICKGVSPSQGVPKIARPKHLPKRNRSWTLAEVQQFMAAAPSLRSAIVVAAFTSLRESDVVALRWEQYRDGQLNVRQEKTGQMVWVAVHSALQRFLDGLERAHEQIVIGPKRRPFSDAPQLASLFYATKKRLKLPMDLTFHGLRTTVAVAVADGGGDTRDIMSLTGHRNERSVAIYVEEADRRRRSKKAVQHLPDVLEMQNVDKTDA